jgi:hypothetical protein
MLSNNDRESAGMSCPEMPEANRQSAQLNKNNFVASGILPKVNIMICRP